MATALNSHFTERRVRGKDGTFLVVLTGVYGVAQLRYRSPGPKIIVEVCIKILTVPAKSLHCRLSRHGVALPDIPRSAHA